VKSSPPASVRRRRAATQAQPENALAWYDLHVALKANGQVTKSTTALETAIRCAQSSEEELPDQSGSDVETYSVEQRNGSFKVIDDEYRLRSRYGGGRAPHRQLSL
jgi:hypothetical protein